MYLSPNGDIVHKINYHIASVPRHKLGNGFFVKMSSINMCLFMYVIKLLATRYNGIYNNSADFVGY